MQSFLVALAVAILEKLITKGTDAWLKFEALRAELEKNKKDADDYQKVVSNPNASRDERKKAEDEILK